MKRALLALLWLPLAAACATGSSAAGPGGLTLLGAAADNADLRAGHALLATHCQRCHALPEPAQKTPEAWPAEVADMSSKAGLSSEQQRLISDYLIAASRALAAKKEIRVAYNR